MIHSSALPDGLTVSRADPADTGDVAGLINAHGLAVAGTRRAVLDDDGDLRTARYIPDAAEQWVVRAASGAVVAHIWRISRLPHVVIEFGLTIHPDYRAPSIASELLNDVEASAQAAVERAPEGARVVAKTTVLSDDTTMVARLRERDFAKVREWVHFELILEGAPAVRLPEGITIRVMDPRVDWPAVGEVMDAAFADHWGEMTPQLRTLLEEDEPVDAAAGSDEDMVEEDDPYSNSLGLCFVAVAQRRVVGSCLCNARTVEWPDSGKLGSLSVLRTYRGRGVGHALTATALAEFHRRGIRRVITDTDTDSFTGANRLYPRFGFRPYRYEHVFEKEIRPGLEWRLMTAEGGGL